MAPFVNQMIARLAAVIIAGFGGWLASTFGIEVTTEHAESLVAGLTALGWILLTGLYAIVRPIISRFIDPTDSALSKQQKDVMQARGTLPPKI